MNYVLAADAQLASPQARCQLACHVGWLPIRSNKDCDLLESFLEVSAIAFLKHVHLEHLDPTFQSVVSINSGRPVVARKVRKVLPNVSLVAYPPRDTIVFVAFGARYEVTAFWTES